MRAPAEVANLAEAKARLQGPAGLLRRHGRRDALGRPSLLAVELSLSIMYLGNSMLALQLRQRHLAVMVCLTAEGEAHAPMELTNLLQERARLLGRAGLLLLLRRGRRDGPCCLCPLAAGLSESTMWSHLVIRRRGRRDGPCCSCLLARRSLESVMRSHLVDAMVAVRRPSAVGSVRRPDLAKQSVARIVLRALHMAMAALRWAILLRRRMSLTPVLPNVK